MAKKSKAELVEEAKALSADIAAIRRAPHNFALLVGSDAVHLAVHKTKGTQAMRNEAKAAGGNAAKGAVGTVEMQGKQLNFTCAEGESPPGSLGKKFKMHMKERGLSFKVNILGSDGSLLEGDEEDDETSDDITSDVTSDKADEPPKDIRQKLEAAFTKFAPMLKEAYQRGGPKRKAALDAIIGTFKDSVAKGDYEQALKSMNQLRDGLVALAKADKIETGEAKTGGADKTALLSKAPQVDTLVRRAGGDPVFFTHAAPKLRELRGNLKAAMADSPTDEELAALTKMKGKLDTLFLNDLKSQGHGPQRHEGDVTPVQLADRAVKGFDPMTGTTVDGGHGGTHGYGANATRFSDPGTYVDAEEFMRADPRTTALLQNAKLLGSGRFEVIIPLKEALGDDYLTLVEGKTRVGSKKHPTGATTETNLENSDLIARYKILSDGSTSLITMFPNPK